MYFKQTVSINFLGISKCFNDSVRARLCCICCKFIEHPTYRLIIPGHILYILLETYALGVRRHQIGTCASCKLSFISTSWCRLRPEYLNGWDLDTGILCGISLWVIKQSRSCNVVKLLKCAYYSHHIHARASFYEHGLTQIQAWVSKHMPGKMCNEITYPFPNSKVLSIFEVWF